MIKEKRIKTIICDKCGEQEDIEVHKENSSVCKTSKWINISMGMNDYNFCSSGCVKDYLDNGYKTKRIE